MTLEPQTTHRHTRRRALWVCVALLLVLVLAVTPPLLNVNRLRRRIAESMSASLGRPVHLDNVSVHLLPVPGFTLENLVVSEDPAFGYEPVIRANTVEATLRPSSLWRRQVEFSTIRFIEPSLNLVRNAQGRWNLQSLLGHAAHVGTAPTEQRKPGPDPRFPYIEATGARVNLKLGDEKKPFSLTEADFALWLPTPAQWRVRLEGKPARTDTNISDPGTVRLEGSLSRAATMADVPVDITASWQGAPLGEASKLLTGEDKDWRGSLTVETTLQGKLGAAKLATKIHLEDLRRADFVPARSLDLQVDCSGVLELMTALVHTPACAVPDHKITAVADSVDLTQLSAAGLIGVKGLRVGTPGVSESWLLDWARLFSQRMPESGSSEPPAGLISGSIAVTGPDGRSHWQGELTGPLAPLLPSAPDDAPRTPTDIALTAEGNQLTLAPLNLALATGAPPLTLSGSANLTSYTLRLEGAVTPADWITLRSAAPFLGDGLEEIFPQLFDTTSKSPVHLDVTCSRPWDHAQACESAQPEAPKRTAHRR